MLLPQLSDLPMGRCGLLCISNNCTAFGSKHEHLRPMPELHSPSSLLQRCFAGGATTGAVPGIIGTSLGLPKTVSIPSLIEQVGV